MGLVWDWPTRLFHWLLATCFVGSWVTAEAGFDWTEVHFLFGYTTLGLVVFRIVWGFVGPAHARFSRFLKSPSVVIDYGRSLFARGTAPSVGHNPLGGWMVVVLLVVVAVQASTGLFLSDDIFYAGPLNPLVSGALADRLAGIHHLNFNVLQGFVALHVVAIGFYGLWKRQNLVTPMLTGRKQVCESNEIASSQTGKALILALVVAGGVWALVAFAPPPVVIDF